MSERYRVYGPNNYEDGYRVYQGTVVLVARCDTEADAIAVCTALNAGDRYAALRRSLGVEYGHHNARGEDGPCPCDYCQIIDAAMRVMG